MDKEKGKIEDCLQNEPAFCTTACPFNFDVRDFIGKMQRGSFNLAFRTYLNTVGFPGIVSTLCKEPCKNVCPKRLKDQAISLKLLERAALTYATRTAPNSYNLPLKNQKVAIIGAGISGLACALRLASRKYAVTIFERSERIGGQLWELLPQELFLKDIELQFMNEEYSLSLGAEITRLDDLEFDAIYVATGDGGHDFGLSGDDKGNFASTKPGVFLGGSLKGRNCVESIADGLHVVNAIEWYLKSGGMGYHHEISHTRLELDPSLITLSRPVLPVDGISFTRDEAIKEANRCLKCACDACIRYCDLMKYFKKYPKRISEEVELTIHPGTLDGNGTIATRFITTCHQCGLCKEVCPKDIDMGDFLLVNHRIMRENGAMPWAYHDFFLRDMAFANSEEAFLCRVPLGFEKCQYLFFPGCRLGASDPRYVTESYQWLLQQAPDTGILLGCCGAPAEWSGDEALHDNVIELLRSKWISLGKPVIVFACPTCKQMFQRYLPEVECEFLYNIILHSGNFTGREGVGETLSVFDPCSSREEPALQQAIRSLTMQAGYALEPLSMEGRLAHCCSWGGHVSIADPQYAREVVNNRVTQNGNPLVTYCINCREIFASTQKPTYHILDIIFGIHNAFRKPPTITEHRNNRVILQHELLSIFWGDNVEMDQRQKKMILLIEPLVRKKLDEELILETDIETVIEHCESSGRKVVDPETGHYSGHLKIGHITYWAEYKPADNGFILINAYSHRMSIEEA